MIDREEAPFVLPLSERTAFLLSAFVMYNCCLIVSCKFTATLIVGEGLAPPETYPVNELKTRSKSIFRRTSISFIDAIDRRLTFILSGMS